MYTYNNAQNNRGFTLVELLVVIFIIGVLASIVLVGGGTQLAKARDAEKVTDIQELTLVLEMYYKSCRQYPADLILSANNGCSGTVALGTFTRSLPGTNVTYATSTTGSAITDYVLRVELERQDRVLRDDVDGADIHGLDCNDASAPFYYCVQPS